MKREIVNPLKAGKFIPKKVLFFYKQEIASNFYVEIADIIEKDKELIQGASRPLTKQMYKRLMSNSIIGEEVYAWKTGIIPEYVLAYDPAPHKRYVIWYRKPEVVEMRYSGDKGKLSGFFPMPGIIYVLTNEKARIFAYKGRKRPDLLTKLYKPPIHNTLNDNEGSICWGTVHKKTEPLYFDDEIALWENMLWKSKFTMHNDYEMKSGKLLSTVLKSIRMKEPVPGKFPANELVETNLQLRNIIKLVI